MKTKKLIELLQKADPSGEQDVCVENVDIIDVYAEPAYWDGACQCFTHNEDGICGAKYKRNGTKISIRVMSISDAVMHYPDLPIDYSELSKDRQEQCRKNHEDVRKFVNDLEYDLEIKFFSDWVYKKAEKLTEDLEEVKSKASSFFIENMPNETKIPPLEIGDSVLSLKEKEWDKLIKVYMKDGFLELEMK